MKHLIRKISGGLLTIALLSSGMLEARIQESVAPKGFKVVGAGELTWWGLEVYHAALYSPDGVYRPDRPHALKITYKMRFSREQLARKSLEEIEHIYGEAAQPDSLQRQLQAVFKDVSPGDHITGVHYPGSGAAFYSDDKLLGRLTDAKLASAFFSIWLDPETREPDLRAKMLGYRQ